MMFSLQFSLLFFAALLFICSQNISCKILTSYEVLGIENNDSCASFSDLKKSFRKLAKKFHPDNKVSGNPESYIRVCNYFDKINTVKKREYYNGKYGLCEKHKWISDETQKKENKEDLIIGIDFGTKFSGVGIYQNNKQVDLIPNEFGDVLTESVIGFPEDGSEPFIGSNAYDEGINPKRVIYDIKRFLGVSADTLRKKNFKTIFDFEDREGKLVFVLPNDYYGTFDIFTPEYIASLILKKFRLMASAYLGREIHRAVISHPVDFQPTQIQALKSAAWIAGLEVQKFVKEPNAAALAYGLTRDINVDKNILVVDFGGGTFDLSLMSVKNQAFKVLETGGDEFLGGEDFSYKLKDWIINDYVDGTSGYIFTTKVTPELMFSFKKKIEKRKKILSVNPETTFTTDFGGSQYSKKISLPKFEYLCRSLFRKFENGLTSFKKKIEKKYGIPDEIVLIGGATKMPKIVSFVKSTFKGKKVLQNINPQEAVVIGAAIEAGGINGRTEIVSLVEDKISFNLGIKLYDFSFVKDEKERKIVRGVFNKGKAESTAEEISVFERHSKTFSDRFEVLINAGSEYPTTGKIVVSTYAGSTTTTIRIYSGEGDFVHDKGVMKIDKLEMSNLKKRGDNKRPEVEVTFVIDETGLYVKAEDVGGDAMNEVEVTSAKLQKLVHFLKVQRKNFGSRYGGEL